MEYTTASTMQQALEDELQEKRTLLLNRLCSWQKGHPGAVAGAKALQTHPAHSAPACARQTTHLIQTAAQSSCSVLQNQQAHALPNPTKRKHSQAQARHPLLTCGPQHSMQQFYKPVFAQASTPGLASLARECATEPATPDVACHTVVLLRAATPLCGRCQALLQHVNLRHPLPLLPVGGAGWRGGPSLAPAMRALTAGSLHRHVHAPPSSPATCTCPAARRCLPVPCCHVRRRPFQSLRRSRLGSHAPSSEHSCRQC